MTFQEKLNQKLIHLFIRPLRRNHPIDFNSCLKDASRVLIACPSSDMVIAQSKVVSEIIGLFPKMDCVVLCHDIAPKHPEVQRIELLLNHPVTPTGLTRSSSFALICKTFSKNFFDRKFDVLLDLDPEYSSINVYLCRALRPSVRISFSKPYSNRYYNFEIDSHTRCTYASRLVRLRDLLSGLLSPS